MKKPVISVIMSVYNTPAEYLKAAVNSILKQTFLDFEFIIIDDFSNPETKQILQTFQDPRIHLYHNPQNYGLTKSLNIALSHSAGKFIARMDSDDISLPQRFQVQVDWMKEHPECGVCGSLIEFLGNNQKYSIRWNQNHEIKRIRMLFYDAGIVHPTAFIRRSVLDDNHIYYNERIKKAQDYALWSELIQVTDIQLIPEVLLKYRVSGSQISTLHHDEQIQYEFMTIQKQLSEFFSLSQEEMNIICHFYRGDIQNTALLNNTLKKMMQQNQQKHIYNCHYFSQQISVLYTQAAIKQKKRFQSSSMIHSSFFKRIFIPTHFAAFMHYMIPELMKA